MESWMPFFVAVTAVAVVFQACMLGAIFFLVLRLGRRMEETMQEIRQRVAPILGRVQMIVDDVHPQLSHMVADAAQITQLARSQVQHADRVVGEAIERLRLQLAHTDQISDRRARNCRRSRRHRPPRRSRSGAIDHRDCARHSDRPRIFPRHPQRPPAPRTRRSPRNCRNAGRKPVHLDSVPLSF